MIWLAAVITTSLLGAPVTADSAARPISLDEAVALAERNALAVVQAQGQARNTAAGVRSAYGAFLPSVNVTSGANRQLPAEPGRTRTENGQVVILSSDPWSFSDALGGSIDLFTGGQHIFDLQQARAQASGAGQNLVIQRYAAILAAKQQFFNVIAARESEAAARAQLALAERQLQTSVVRLRARLVTRSDSLRSEIQLHNAGLAVIQARAALDLANASLTRAVGSPELVTAAADDSLDRPGLALDDEALRGLALDGPAVRQATASLEAARASLRAVWATYLPTVTASYSRSGSGSAASFAPATTDLLYTGTVRLSLSLPIFDQFQRAGQTTQAKVAVEDAEAALRDARLGALVSLTQWLGSLHAAGERVAVQAATIQAAEEDLREQQEKYTLGTSTMVDVLTSQSTLDQARHDLIQARYDQRVAKAQLEALVGRNL